MYAQTAAPDPVLTAFRNPPRQARTHCYWWWLNGNTDRATITRDLEQMKAKGYGGAILIDANGSNQFRNKGVPAGPLFASDAWRTLYRHAIQEAARLNLEISLTIQSGWNLGGPGVKPEQASKILTFTRLVVSGPASVSRTLPAPAENNGFYRDIAVLAYPLLAGKALAGSPGDARQAIRQLSEKAAFREFGWSMPETSILLKDVLPQPDEQDYRLADVQNLTARMSSAGQLRWNAPAGDWEILRIGYTDSGTLVSTSSGAWQGLAIDYLDHEAFEAYWNQTVKPLIDDARPFIGKALRYLVTDSWELRGTNWTARFAEKFRRRRGYDVLPFLPVVAGRIAESRDVSNRFLNDFRKTIGGLIRDEHYGTFARLAKAEGLGIHPESGGPHGAPIDGLKTLGVSSFPQTEFWAKSATHRSTDEDRFFMKEASSAAHTYGKTLVAGEGMTSIGPQWEEAIWNDLKPTFDQAVCSGLNLLFWHTFTSAPRQFGLPGREYFAGTHLNPNVTWWNYAGPFIAYLNRTQAVMQQGLPVSDVLYYYGDRVPNFVQLKSADPARVLPGYDYDVVDERVLTTAASVSQGQIVLESGTSYRLLALGQKTFTSLAAIRKLRDLVMAGATVVGEKPERTTGLENGPRGDTEVRQIASEVWGNCGEGAVQEHRFGAGRVYCGPTVRQVLEKLNVPPDFEYGGTGAPMDYLHRKVADSDLYFVRNGSPNSISAAATFRVNGKAPVFLHSDTGAVSEMNVYQSGQDAPGRSDGRTRLPLSLEPYGSAIIVFTPTTREHFTVITRDGKAFPASEGQPAFRRSQGRWSMSAETAGRYQLRTSSGKEWTAEVHAVPAAIPVSGEWTLRFPPGWNAPAVIRLPHLSSWSEHADPGVRYFSGTGTYSTAIALPAGLLQAPLFLDLGEVREIAQVKLNGKDLGILWKKPFRVEVNGAARPGINRLTVAVTNLWPNRLIGDQGQPVEKRLTSTNITKFKADTPLLPSGLLGPVKLVPGPRAVALRAR